VDRLRPLYPNGERGRPPIGLERMLRIYFLQQWYGLADEALADALYDSQALRSFADIDLTVASAPDATTLLKFRHWLEQHDLTVCCSMRSGRYWGTGRARFVVAPGHDRRCDHHRRPALDQEPQQDARSGDAPDPKGQPMALRDERNALAQPELGCLRPSPSGAPTSAMMHRSPNLSYSEQCSDEVSRRFRRNWWKWKWQSFTLTLETRSG
jgi:hypothetical protein